MFLVVPQQDHVVPCDVNEGTSGLSLVLTQSLSFL